MSKLINPYHYFDKLLLWLDGADPYGNENASTPTHNSSLSTWYDKSINRYLFTATSGNEPTYNATNKKVEFDGSEHMACTVSNFPDDQYHLFIVGSITLTQNSELNVILAGDATTNHDFTFVAEHDTDTDSDTDGVVDQVRPVFSYQGLSTAGATSCSSNFDAGDGTVGIFEVLAGSATTTFTDVNNRNIFVGSNGQQGVNSITAHFVNEYNLKLMKNNESAEQETVGTIHEVLMFKKLLPKQDRLAIQGYLKHKYGLADSILLAGKDDAEADYDFHRFLTEAPKVNDSVITTISGSVTNTLPDLFQGLHRKNPRTPFTFVRLSLDENNDNSDSTYGDGIEARGGIKQYYFTQEVGDVMSGLVDYSFPCLQSITPAPVEIVPTKGVALRGNVTVKLADFIRGDDTVSFFSKFMAQNPYYLGRRIEIFEGFVDDNFDASSGTRNEFQYFDGRREYIIDSMHLTNDMVTIKAKDPFSLGDDLKSKVPEPTRFSLAEELGNNNTYSHINLKFDDLTLDGSSSDDKAKVTDYFGADNATGFIRINEEILGYRVDVSGSEAALDITSRDQWGTKRSTSTDAGDNYEVGDSVQKCLVFGDYNTTSLGSTIDTVANELLVNQAGISSDLIETDEGVIYSWTDERKTWLDAFKINTVLSEPKEVNKTLSEIATSVGAHFFYDDNAGKIRLKAEAPIIDQSDFITVTDNDIIYKSFKLKNSEKERISRLFYYYSLKNSTEDKNEPKNFKNLYVNIDGSSEGSTEYNQKATKTIFGWAIKDTSTATTIAQRLINRFNQTPVTCEFELDSSNDYLQTGDHFFLETKHILKPDGTQKNLEMQCLSVTYDSKKQTNKIKAKSFRFGTNNLGLIAGNSTANATGGGYSTGAQSQTATTGSGSGMAIRINSVDGSGVITDHTVTNYGVGLASGDVVSFGSGFTITFASGFFASDGGGTGTETDPYTGNRAAKAYISCDSPIPTANGGNNSKQFIEVSLVTAGSGYANGTHTFSGAEIEGVTQGTGLELSVTVSGNAVTAVSVTSNPATGDEIDESSHKGYTEQVVTLTGHSGTGATVRITPSAKMSTGGEPYIIV